jgi:hypothetical protein
MSKYVGALVVILIAFACGGTTDTGDESTGGAAGKGVGGSLDFGGAAAVGGSVVLVGGFGGAGGIGTLDPRCPPRLPSGECEGDVTLSCQYDDNTGCLCYSPPPHYAFCQEVDPTCPSGAEGGAPPEAGAGGVGGFSTKIVLPPRLVCRCTESMWACGFGS